MEHTARKEAGLVAGLLEALDHLLNRFFASAEFRAYESLCLDGWKSVLSPEAVAILDRQLQFPSRRVQRQFAGKVAVLYCLGDPGCERLPREVGRPPESRSPLSRKI